MRYDFRSVALTCLTFAVLQAWLRTRSPLEKKVFNELFDGSFLKIYTWVTQNLMLMMDVLQCNFIQQMIYILDGLVPVTGENEQEVALSTTGSLDGIVFIYSIYFHINVDYVHTVYKLFASLLSRISLIK